MLKRRSWLKTRSALARSKPIERTTPVKKKRETPRKSGRVLNASYLDQVRGMPCYVCGRPPRSEADHQGPHPLGRKSNDDEAVPMCGGPGGCHQMRTDGYIWDRDAELWRRADAAQMRTWCDRAILITRLRLGYTPAYLGDSTTP